LFYRPLDISTWANFMLTDATPDAWQKALMLPLVALLEGAGNDLKSSWAQAIKLICGFMPATEPEHRLSVRIAIFNIQSNLAFCWAAQEETTISQAIRLQQNGMALAKAADQAQARLSQLQTERIERAEAAAAAKQAGDASTADALFPAKETEARQTEAPEADAPQIDAPQIGAPEAEALTAEASRTEPRKAQTSQPRIDEAKVISEYARANKMTYPQAWSQWQRAKKAAKALLQSQLT
jgi:hypothetical protein